MQKHSWTTEKPLPSLESYQEAIVIMMRYGNSLEAIAKSFKVPEPYLINFLNTKGIIDKLKGRSWTYKGKPKRKRKSPTIRGRVV